MEEDINKSKSSKKGLLGLVENLFRKFSVLGFALALTPIAVMYILCLGVSVFPGILVLTKIHESFFGNIHQLSYLLFMSFGVALGFVLFIFTMILIVPFCNFFIPFKNVSYKGAWFSLQSIPWYYHNALTYLVRYTILDFITPSPINILFFKLMGMKIGKNVMINTSNISDPCKITLGDNVTLGGSCYLMAHYGVNGYLVIDKLIINDRSTIGLSAKILGGVVIGKNVVVGPNVVILPKSNIEDGTKLKVS